MNDRNFSNSDSTRYTFEMLFLLNHGCITNAKISRILRKDPASCHVKLLKLKDVGLVEQNDELEYGLTDKGIEEIDSTDYNTPYYNGIRKSIERLKDNPEPKGWDPKQVDLGGITLAEADILYMFEENDSFSNAEIANIMRRDESSTSRNISTLCKNNLLKKEGMKYSLTPEGQDRITTNVNKNKRCEITLEFAQYLKANSPRRGLLLCLGASIAALFGINKDTHTTAYAIESKTTMLQLDWPIMRQLSSSRLCKVTTTTTTTVGTTGTAAASASTITLVSILAVAGITGAIAMPGLLDSQTQYLELEDLVLAGNAVYNDGMNDNKSHGYSLEYVSPHFDRSLELFQDAAVLYENTEFYPNHAEAAQRLYLNALIGIGNSLQSKSAYGTIDEFTQASEEQYDKAIELFGNNENLGYAENAHIGKAINAIYHTPSITIEECSQFNSVNSNMCKAEALAYQAAHFDGSVEEMNESFDNALRLAQADVDNAEDGQQKYEAQKRLEKLQEDIPLIKEYYGVE